VTCYTEPIPISSRNPQDPNPAILTNPESAVKASIPETLGDNITGERMQTIGQIDSLMLWIVVAYSDVWRAGEASLDPGHLSWNISGENICARDMQGRAERSRLRSVSLEGKKRASLACSTQD
jgi:hypothetical protein